MDIKATNRNERFAFSEVLIILWMYFNRQAKSPPSNLIFLYLLSFFFCFCFFSNLSCLISIPTPFQNFQLEINCWHYTPGMENHFSDYTLLKSCFSYRNSLRKNWEIHANNSGWQFQPKQKLINQKLIGSFLDTIVLP